MPKLHKLAARRGLYLRIGKTVEGRAPPKSWTFVVHLPARLGRGRQRMEMGLGAFSAVKLADAREKARAAREMVAGGRDPRAVRDEAAAARREKPTFAEEGALALKTLRSDWRGAKTVARWNLAMKYAEPFAAKPVDEVTTDDVLGVLQRCCQSNGNLSPAGRTSPTPTRV